ncbi:MAG: SGNH/GDSL hydrolase family protein [Gemmatimonadaceae bacterium]|nr:SGNH/GDSL hydrolase family protein [Gemmatimonadaceae bacterium]
MSRHVGREFARYISLGDGLSADLTPALDLKVADVSVALERDARSGDVPPVGASSLLFSNDDERWPDFLGLDLQSLTGCSGIVRLATDGASIGDIFDEQVLTLEGDGSPTLVTLTAGAIDLLSAVATKPAPARRDAIVRDAVSGVLAIAELLHARFDDLTLVLTTLPDPTDGLGTFADARDGDAVPPAALLQFNAQLRERAARLGGTIVAEAHAAFQGHGMTAPEGERWFWRRSPHEPSAAGASGLRACWLDALGVLP